MGGREEWHPGRSTGAVVVDGKVGMCRVGVRRGVDFGVTWYIDDDGGGLGGFGI